MLFYGKYEHSLDNKYRVRIPARLKAELGTEAPSIAKGEDGSLVIYPASTINTIGEKIKTLGVPKAKHKNLMVFMSSIYPIDEDSQGRFTLNATLRAHAGISKDIVFVGFNDRIMLWDKARWEAYEANSNNDEEFDLSDYGIWYGISTLFGYA